MLLGRRRRGGQLHAGEARLPRDPPGRRRHLRRRFLQRGGAGGGPSAAARGVGRRVGRQRLQQLGGGAEASVLLGLGRLGERRQGGAAPAAGVAAQLAVARDGAVPRQHLHLAEDGLVSATRLI